MKSIVSIGVAKDGTGHSAFGYTSDGERFRLSPTWLKETFVEVLQEFDVPSANDRKRTVKVKRIAPRKTGHRLQYGESLDVAISRAKKALDLIATGKQPTIPDVKAVPN